MAKEEVEEISTSIDPSERVVALNITSHYCGELGSIEKDKAEEYLAKELFY